MRLWHMLASYSRARSFHFAICGWCFGTIMFTIGKQNVAFAQGFSTLRLKVCAFYIAFHSKIQIVKLNMSWNSTLRFRLFSDDHCAKTPPANRKAENPCTRTTCSLQITGPKMQPVNRKVENRCTRAIFCLLMLKVILPKSYLQIVENPCYCEQTHLILTVVSGLYFYIFH